ncbi:signal peptidase I [Halobacteriales archaeon QS_1_68_20]|nr:MAG: signal peptidase I [Halobacteriales archaeon QS_1_68_20]
MAEALVPLVALGFTVVVLAGMWKAFTKAGEPGWAVIIPFYNYWVMLRIGGNDDIIWFIGMFVPLVNIYVAYRMFTDVAKSFGQGIGFGLGLWILSFIFWPILGFGNYQYRGSAA